MKTNDKPAEKAALLDTGAEETRGMTLDELPNIFEGSRKFLMEKAQPELRAKVRAMLEQNKETDKLHLVDLIDFRTEWKKYPFEGMYFKEVPLEVARVIFRSYGAVQQLEGQTVFFFVLMAPDARTKPHNHGTGREFTVNIRGDLGVNSGGQPTMIINEGQYFNAEPGVDHCAQNARRGERIVIALASFSEQPEYNNTPSTDVDAIRNGVANGANVIVDIRPKATFQPA